MDSTFAALERRHSVIWDAAQNHPFVHALGDGSLERGKFIHYLKQDYIYLQAYARAVNIAAAKAPDLTLMTEFTALAHETLGTEMQLHRDYCAAFGITADQLAAVEASPVCQAYGDFCISTAATGDCLELLAALVPCGVGYAEIGARLRAQQQATDQPYRQWIETYGGAEYEQYAAWLVTALEALAREVPAARLARLNQLFVLGCRYEWLFWEMAWRLDGWPEIEQDRGSMR